VNRGTLDPIRAQILWNRLLAVVEEQAQTLVRTAFSTTVREAGDLSAGVFDRRGRMLAQAVTGTPGHVNAMAASVGFFLQKHPVDSLRDGDVLVTNDPWHGTGHLNDFTVVTPVFKPDDGMHRCVALFAATSHIADVGGLGFGPDGRQVFEEGLNIPIGYLFRAGAPNQVLLDILQANVRDPRAALGDLHSLAACNRAGAASLLASLKEFALDGLEDIAETIIGHSRDAMLAEIRKLPAGTWRNAMRIDGYDDPVDLVCR
jgi:N-methylhydantoinase B